MGGQRRPVTRLSLPVAGDLHKFTVGVYVLKDRERSDKTVREFRDRALLTADFLEHNGHLFGHANRTDADGARVALRFHRSMQRLARGQDEVSVRDPTRVFHERLLALSWFEMPQDSVGSRISAKGS